LGSARHATVEPDHRTAARVPSRHDLRGLTLDDQLGSHLEAFGCVARILDDERTIETVRLADTSDDDCLRRVHVDAVD
jgi:hypothetical protein